MSNLFGQKSQSNGGIFANKSLIGQPKKKNGLTFGSFPKPYQQSSDDGLFQMKQPDGQQKENSLFEEEFQKSSDKKKDKKKTQTGSLFDFKTLKGNSNTDKTKSLFQAPKQNNKKPFSMGLFSKKSETQNTTQPSLFKPLIKNDPSKTFSSNPQLSKDFSFNQKSFQNQQNPNLFNLGQNTNRTEPFNGTSLFEPKKNQGVQFSIPTGDAVLGITSKNTNYNKSDAKDRTILGHLTKSGREPQNTPINFANPQMIFKKNPAQQRPPILFQQQQTYNPGLLDPANQYAQYVQLERQERLQRSALNHPLALFQQGFSQQGFSQQFQPINEVIPDRTDVYLQMTVGDFMDVLPTIDKDIQIKFKKLGMSVKQREIQYYRRESRLNEILEQFSKIQLARQNIQERINKVSDLIQKSLLKNVKLEQMLKIVIGEQKLNQGDEFFQPYKIEDYSYNHHREQSGSSRVNMLIERAIRICKTTEVIKEKIYQLQQSLNNNSSKGSSSIRVLNQKDEASQILQTAQNKIDELLKISKQCSADEQIIKSSEQKMQQLITPFKSIF